MGCSICLEGYEDDSEKSKRPVTLICGHIFHKACSDGWLKICRTRSDAACCPLCKTMLGPSRAVTLWPNNVKDLDQYLRSRNRAVEGVTERAETTAIDRYMSRKAQTELLGHLMDFRQHINAFVMATNNIYVPENAMDDRVLQLFLDLHKDEEKEQIFDRSMQALSSAAQMLNTSLSDIETMKTSTESGLRQIQLREKRMKEKEMALDRHCELKERHERHMKEEHAKVRKLSLQAQTQMRDLERERENMEKQRKSNLFEAQEKMNEAHKMRVQTTTLLAQCKGNAQQEVQTMKEYVLDQERLRLEADKAARDAKERSSYLADRLRIVSTKLDTARAEAKRLKESSRRLSQDDSTSAFMVKSEEVEAYPSGSASNERNSSSSSSSSLIRKGKKRECGMSDMNMEIAIKLEDDGFAEVDHRPARKVYRVDDDDDDSKDSSGNGRVDNAIIVLDDDLDAELDDPSYQVPGLRAAPLARPPSTLHSDDSVEITEVKRNEALRSFTTPLADQSRRFVNSSTMGGLLALGPRRRFRAS